jgi:hypothetical protein
LLSFAAWYQSESPSATYRVHVLQQLLLSLALPHLPPMPLELILDHVAGYGICGALLGIVPV